MHKGTARTLSEATHGECWCWVHPLSPNARVVWHLLLFSIFANLLWYAWSTGDVVANLRSLVWGLNLRGYPPYWWKP